ncbi:hypothetical protein PVL29_007955 [Vitis rotundifolia]|uniref:Uncharacterized protein n=1 Tax=Vitis rotundifolia TaxID=103349 RepID=A0AA39A1H6_VITRO|nr:hypothetical protein PVL29_007955 [Vitis rotundifolia]
MATEYSSGGFLTTAVVPWGDQWKKMRRVLASHVINPSTFRWLLTRDWKKPTILSDTFITSVRSVLAITVLA